MNTSDTYIHLISDTVHMYTLWGHKDNDTDTNWWRQLRQEEVLFWDRWRHTSGECLRCVLQQQRSLVRGTAVKPGHAQKHTRWPITALPGVDFWLHWPIRTFKKQPEQQRGSIWTGLADSAHIMREIWEWSSHAGLWVHALTVTTEYKLQTAPLIVSEIYSMIDSSGSGRSEPNLTRGRVRRILNQTSFGIFYI